MQDHYIQVLGEKLGIGYEIMRVQYVQYAKNEGKFILQQANRKKENPYQIDRELLIAALFYQEFIRQFIESQERRIPLLTLMERIMTTLPDTAIAQATKDESQKDHLLELQLRWDKELNNGKEEEKRYQIIKQILLSTLQGYIQRITKDPQISGNDKQEILNLMRKI